VAGKTTPDPKIILASEDGDTQGLQTLQDFKIPFIELRDWPTAELVLAEMMRFKDHCQYQGTTYTHVIADSYSCFGTLWMDLALKMLGRTEVGMAGPGWDPRRPYGYVAEKGRQATKKLMMLRAHLICVAREGLAEEGEGTDKVSYPCIELPGAKLYKELPGSFDAVVRLKMVSGKRVFVTETENRAVAGVRVPESMRLPRYVKPDIGLLIKVMMGDRDALNEITFDADRKKTAPVSNR
jgi:hypothetical protein